MLTRLALAVLEERDRLTLPSGSAALWRYVDAHAYTDRPVLAAVRDRMRREVATFLTDAGTKIDAADVSLAEVSPDELDAAWRRHAPMDPPPTPPDVYVLLGYWTPPKEGTRP